MAVRDRGDLWFLTHRESSSPDTVASFSVGLHWGIRGVAIAYALTNTVLLTPLRLVVVNRLLGYRLRSFASELRGVTEATVLMAAFTLVVRELLEMHGIGNFSDGSWMRSA